MKETWIGIKRETMKIRITQVTLIRGVMINRAMIIVRKG